MTCKTREERGVDEPSASRAKADPAGMITKEGGFQQTLVSKGAENGIVAELSGQRRGISDQATVAWM